MMKKLFAICLLTIASFTVKAQSHISTGKYQCQLVPKSLNSEKYPCPACAKIAEEKRLAKVAEDKKQFQASVESAKASLAASIATNKKRQEEMDKNNKVTEIGLSMSTSGSTSTSNISAQNPLSTAPATTTIQETQRQAYEQAQAAKAAKAELTAQIVTQAGSLVGGLLDDWNAASERKAQRRDTERLAAITASVKEERQKKSDKFEFVYLPLMDLAKKGDENARMILYFSSWRLGQESLVPLREQWLEKALANKNIDALLMKAVAALNAYKKGDEKVITDMEKIAEMGSEDAMLTLAMWYSHKTNIDGISGGGNEKKALEWFNKAAGVGSPNAMYFLGMIYKYGQVVSDKYEQKLFIKFTVPKDETLALDWFIKAEQPLYKESIYSRFQSSNAPFLANTSYYIPCRNETYLLYKKGKTVRDEAKAEEMKKEMEAENSKHSIDYDNYKKANEKFGDIN